MINERSWAGHVISWIKEAINNGSTIFQEATNDEGIIVTGGKTRFPDILLFVDKTAGIVLNGWELKYPNTAIDDIDMLINALEKAKFLHSNSIVTWNANQVIIWGIHNNDYELDNLYEIKRYPASVNITKRSDLENRSSYLKNEVELKNTLMTILADLQSLYQNGTIIHAIDISSDIVIGIKNASDYLINLFEERLSDAINSDVIFQSEFARWKILEKATLNILKTSSSGHENIRESHVLARFMFYKLIGKILFYETLTKNLPQHIQPINFTEGNSIKEQLDAYFQTVRDIDFQAVFDSDFTDALSFNKSIDHVLIELINLFQSYDFRILPSEVIGTILENLVPPIEKRKFGQYFTPKNLTYLVSLSALRTRDANVFDPTSGTGSFLDAFYKIKKKFGQTNHQTLLTQIWGNDISHFPAVLSVINLYKQDVTITNNFPRVTRRDFFDLQPNTVLPFPDPNDETVLIDEELPKFDAIISNFPFIQQEDIQNNILCQQFETEFGNSQSAFLKNNRFDMNERADYFVYCFYHSLKFLKENGQLAAISSNAWLGKDYGLQFKKFILDNFSINYIVKSNAEHWFQDSKVSTLFTTIQKGASEASSKFITINAKLEDLTHGMTDSENIKFYREFYFEIDNCNLPENKNWHLDSQFQNVFHKNDGTIKVSIISKKYLLNQINTAENWNINFIAENPLIEFNESLVNPFPDFIDSGRGTKTCFDDFHILSQEIINRFEIENDMLLPILRSNRNVLKIKHILSNEYMLFVCDKSENEINNSYPGVKRWLEVGARMYNQQRIPLPEKFTIIDNRQTWYSLTPEDPANIFISVNPNKRLFFGFSETYISLNQRFVAIRVPENEVYFYAALFNSILSLLIVELNGVSRNLGALDLNANFFKTKMKILNPNLINEDAKQRIVSAFLPITERNQLDYNNEFVREDRKHLDKTIFSEFGFDLAYIPKLYELLLQTITDRIEMKDR